MNVRDLIAELTRLLEDGVSEETPVRFAYQRHFPLYASVEAAVVVDENEPDPDEGVPDYGNYDPSYVVYLGEGWESSKYLSGAARRALEWNG